MATEWPELAYADWSATCDTLHAHTQVLGKFAVALAPPEPQLQHAALRLTARGWESAPLPAPDGSGAFVVALDLHAHEALVEHNDGRVRRIALAPDRPVAEVTRELQNLNEVYRHWANVYSADPYGPRAQEALARMAKVNRCSSSSDRRPSSGARASPIHRIARPCRRRASS